MVEACAHHSTATASAATDPGVVLCVADGIVRIAAGIIRAAVRLSGGIDRLIGVTAGEEKRCDHDRDAEPHGRFPTHWSRPVGRSFGRCAGEVGHHALRRRGGDLIEQRTLNFNSCDLQDIVRELRAKGVTLKATEQPIDTSTTEGTAFLDMLGVFAEFETTLRRERQMEGIAAAKARGVYKGRPQSIEAEEVKRLRAEDIGATDIARRLGIGRASVYRVLAEAQGATYVVPFHQP
jgi:Resolvase, N terminal domain/Helix-turn-helix domain of resolvase